MVCTTLLPQDAVLRHVGGPGREFWAAGKNWDIVKDGLNQENLALMGQWRVEVTPAKPRKKDLFLHVIQVGDTDLATPSKPGLIEADTKVGVQLSIAETQWEIQFNTGGPLGGHMKRQDQGHILDRALTMDVQKQVGIAGQDR